jgi:hypothetical protein
MLLQCVVTIPAATTHFSPQPLLEMVALQEWDVSFVASSTFAFGGNIGNQLRCPIFVALSSP